MKKFSNLLWGLVLIMVGSVWALNATGVTDIDLFFKGWWTLFIIVPSFIGMFDKKDLTSNIVGLIIGIALLLCTRGMLDFDLILDLIVPIVLIVIGLSLVFKNFMVKKINEKVKKLDKNSDEVYATFSSQKIDFDNEEYKGTSLNAIFGSIRCDLKNAKMENESIINTTSIFGGIELIVPSDVKVIVKSTSIFGGVEEKHKKKDDSKDKVLYVNATCLFGGVDIK